MMMFFGIIWKLFVLFSGSAQRKNKFNFATNQIPSVRTLTNLFRLFNSEKLENIVQELQQQ